MRAQYGRQDKPFTYRELSKKFIKHDHNIKTERKNEKVNKEKINIINEKNTDDLINMEFDGLLEQKSIKVCFDTEAYSNFIRDEIINDDDKISLKEATKIRVQVVKPLKLQKRPELLSLLTKSPMSNSKQRLLY